MELYVVVEPFVKAFHLVLDPLLAFVDDLQHAQHDLVVGVVFFLELLQDCDDDPSDRRDDGGEDQRPVAVHVTPLVRGVWRAIL